MGALAPPQPEAANQAPRRPCWGGRRCLNCLRPRGGVQGRGGQCPPGSRRQRGGPAPGPWTRRLGRPGLMPTGLPDTQPAWPGPGALRASHADGGRGGQGSEGGLRHTIAPCPRAPLPGGQRDLLIAGNNGHTHAYRPLFAPGSATNTPSPRFPVMPPPGAPTNPALKPHSLRSRILEHTANVSRKLQPPLTHARRVHAHVYVHTPHRHIPTYTAHIQHRHTCTFTHSTHQICTTDTCTCSHTSTHSRRTCPHMCMHTHVCTCARTHVHTRHIYSTGTGAHVHTAHVCTHNTDMHGHMWRTYNSHVHMVRHHMEHRHTCS